MGATGRSRARDDERGATAIEYGLLVALIAAVVIAAVIVLGTVTDGLYRSPCTQLASHTSISC